MDKAGAALGNIITMGTLAQRRQRTAILLLAPALLVLAAVILYPIASSIVLSLQDAQLSAGEIGAAWIGLENYRQLAEDDAFALALRNSAFFTVSEVAIVLVIALGVALLLNTHAGRNPVFTVILLVPWVIAPVANVLLVPVVPYAMLLGTVALVGALVWLPLGQWLAPGAYVVLAWLTEGARLLAGVPYAAVQLPPFPLWVLLAYYAAVIGGWLWARRGRIAGE